MLRLHLHAPAPAAHVGKPFVGGTALVRDAEVLRDHRFARMRHLRVEFFAQAELHRQHAGIAPAKERERAMRRHGADRFAVVVVVAEFLAFLALLAVDHRRHHAALVEQVMRAACQAISAVSPNCSERMSRAPSSAAFTSATPFSASTNSAASVCGSSFGSASSAVGERLEPGFAGDLRARAALRLVREIQVFEDLLAVGAFDRGAQFVGELALLADAREDRRAAVFEFAQIQQPFLEIAQLRIVEIAGHFLAIPGDERDGCAFIEELHGGGDLARLNGQLGGDALYDLECYGFRHGFLHGLLAHQGRRRCAQAPREARGSFEGTSTSAGLVKRGILP